MRGIFIVLAFLIVGTPSFASETWNCDFTPTSGSARGIPGKAKIEVDGDVLKWQVPFPSKSGTKWTTFPRRILENNDIGIVAATSDAEKYTTMGSDKHVETVIGAGVVVLDKSTGVLHAGSVTLDTEHDSLIGHCDRERR